MFSGWEGGWVLPRVIHPSPLSFSLFGRLLLLLLPPPSTSSSSSKAGYIQCPDVARWSAGACLESITVAPHLIDKSLEIPTVLFPTFETYLLY